MDERVAESEIDWMDLDDKVDTLRKGHLFEDQTPCKGYREREALPSPRPEGLDLDREDRINRLGVSDVLFLSF